MTLLPPSPYPAPASGTATALAPLVIHEALRRAPALLTAAAGALAASSPAVGRPPTDPAAKRATASAIAPTIVRVLTLTPGRPGPVACAIAPVVAHEDLTRSPATLRASARALAPTIAIADKASSVSAPLRGTAAVRTPALWTRRVQGLAGASSGVLAPGALVHGALTLTPATLSSLARVPAFRVTSPLQTAFAPVFRASSRALAPAIAPATLTITPATVRATMRTRQGTPYKPTGRPAVVIALELAGRVEWNPEEARTLTPTVQQNPVGLELVSHLVDEAGRPADLTGATLSVYMRSPRGFVRRRAALVEGDASHGRAVYTTVPGDLAEFGTWTVQVLATWPGGRELWSSLGILGVVENAGPELTTIPALPTPRAQARAIAPVLVFA